MERNSCPASDAQPTLRNDQACASVELSPIEPDVFHAPTVEDAVDHQGQPLHIRLPTRPAAAVEDDRSGTVLRQIPFDLPNQLLSLLLVCFARLPTNELLY